MTVYSDQSIMHLYAGTYTKREAHVHGKGQGIYTFEIDSISGEINYLDCLKNVINPTHFVFNSNGQYLYTVNEHWFDLGPTGTISSYAVDRFSNKINLINRQSSGGLAPCFISIDRYDQFVFVANYQTGEIAAFLLLADGQIGELIEVHKLEGNGPHEEQDGPHPHCILADPSNKYVIVTNLGADLILIYRLDIIAGKPLLRDPVTFHTEPGDGPRHLIFHPNNHFIYVINELSSTIIVFEYTSRMARLMPVQRISTLPDSFRDDNTCADIHITPSGEFLYGSNRGHDSIAVFSVNRFTGKLDPVDYISSGGRSPRSFTIDPTGTFMFVANQDSDNIVSFVIDQRSGIIQRTGYQIEIPTPVCVKLSRRISSKVQS